MTRRTRVLDVLEPPPVASLHPDTLCELDAQPGDLIIQSSRRGKVKVTARTDDAMQTGQVFLPFCYHEAAGHP